MRSFVAFLAGLLAMVCLTVLIPLVWVATHIASEDGYVDFSSSLIQDQQFRDGLSAATVDALVERAGLPAGTLDAVGQRLSAAADELVATEKFADVWADVQRQSHRVVFTDPRDLPAELDASNRLVIDVTPVAQALVDSAADRLPVSVDVPGQMLVTVGGNDQRDLIEQIRATPQVALMLGVLTIGLAAVSVVAARTRRAAIGWLGLGAVGSALIVRVVTHQVVPEVLNRNTSPSRVGQRMQDLLVDAAVSSLDRAGVIVMIAGGVIAVGALLTRGRGLSST